MFLPISKHKCPYYIQVPLFIISIFNVTERMTALYSLDTSINLDIYAWMSAPYREIRKITLKPYIDGWKFPQSHLTWAPEGLQWSLVPAVLWGHIPWINVSLFLAQTNNSILDTADTGIVTAWWNDNTICEDDSNE